MCTTARATMTVRVSAMKLREMIAVAKSEMA